MCKACFGPYLCVCHLILVLGARGGCPKGLVHNLLLQFFTLGSSKIEVFKTDFFNTVIFCNDHPRYVKHVLGRIYVLVILFWYWVRRAGVPTDWYTTCFCSFSPWAAKNQSLRNLVFFDTVIFRNDHPRYVKHVLGRIYVFVIVLWYWVRRAGVPTDWYTTCFCSFSPWAAKNQSLRNLVFFDTVIFRNDHPRYVKHVLGRIYVFVILFWYGVRGAGGPRDWYTTCFCSFSPRTAQKLKFSKLIFLIP